MDDEEALDLDQHFDVIDKECELPRTPPVQHQPERLDEHQQGFDIFN